MFPIPLKLSIPREVVATASVLSSEVANKLDKVLIKCCLRGFTESQPYFVEFWEKKEGSSRDPTLCSRN